MSFTKLSDLLTSAATRSGDPSGLEGAHVIQIAQKEIGKILGEIAIGHVRAKSYKDGILTFAVSSGVWAHHIRMKERKIYAILKPLIHPAQILKIRYTITSYDQTN